MKIIVTSIFVEDQEKALAFYTKTLGFVLKHDVPSGQYRWIALVSPDEEAGTELILEPNVHSAAKEYQERLFADGIPATMFGVEDIQEEYQRLLDLGVEFKMKPTNVGPVTIAIFNDTCGNYIQIAENNKRMDN